MKQIHRPFVIFVCLIFWCSLTGCIGYVEELWINADGSGKIKLLFYMPEFMAQMAQKKGDNPFDEEKARAEFENVEGVEFIESKTYLEAGNQFLSFTLGFDSWEKLKALQTEDTKDPNQDLAGLFGDIQLGEDDNGNMTFSRTIDISQKQKGNDFGNEMIRALMGQYTWKYIVHFPVNLVSANAVEDDIDFDTNTVSWEYNLVSLIEEPKTMQATLKKPTSVIFYLLVGGGIVLFVCIIGLVRRSV